MHPSCRQVGVTLVRGKSRIATPQVIWRTGRPVTLLSSDFMRADQLRTILVPHLGEQIDLVVSAVNPRNALDFEVWLRRQTARVHILLKHVAYRMTPEQVARLRSRSIAVGVDHIDGDLSKVDLSLFDFHISASISGAAALSDALRSSGTGVFRLLHHSDPRLGGLAIRDLEAPRAVYVGRGSNAILPKSVENRVKSFEVGADADMARIVPRLTDFNVHYCVRPNPSTANPLRSYKPFTKGHTAAACGSNVIACRGTDDVEASLGRDYPFLIDTADSKSILDCFSAVEGSFGGPVWREALERMRDLNQRVAPRSLAHDFQSIIAAVTA